MIFNKSGFTLVELLIIVAIIGLLASIIIVAWAVSAQNRAAVVSYKTSMDSVRTAAEMCRVSNGTLRDGLVGSSICDHGGGLLGQEKYPTIPAKCGDINSFVVNNPAGTDWQVTTSEACRGCRLICSTTECQSAAAPDDQCN